MPVRQKLRAKIVAAGREHPVDALIDHVYGPVRQRLSLDHNTARIMCSMFDGVLIEYVAATLTERRRKSGKEALLIGWEIDDRVRLWLEAGVCLSPDGTFPYWQNRSNLLALNSSQAKRYLSGQGLLPQDGNKNYCSTGTSRVTQLRSISLDDRIAVFSAFSSETLVCCSLQISKRINIQHDTDIVDVNINYPARLLCLLHARHARPSLLIMPLNAANSVFQTRQDAHFSCDNGARSPHRRVVLSRSVSASSSQPGANQRAK